MSKSITALQTLAGAAFLALAGAGGAQAQNLVTYMNFEGKGYILDNPTSAACQTAQNFQFGDEWTVVLKYTGFTGGVAPDTVSFVSGHSVSNATAAGSINGATALTWNYINQRGIVGNYVSSAGSNMTVVAGSNAAISLATGNIKMTGVINDFLGNPGCTINVFHAALVVRPN